MPWTLDKKRAKFSPELTDSDQNKWDEFQDLVHKGTSPVDAAKKARCDDYKKLTGDQYQIRLSGCKQNCKRIASEPRPSLNPKSEDRRPKEGRRPKSERGVIAPWLRPSDLEFRISFELRASAFGFQGCRPLFSLPLAALGGSPAALVSISTNQAGGRIGLPCRSVKAWTV